ncbi:MAG TPA: ester cyclase [Phototrophicaceae bacterium]|jgi:hypothetical protein|nr:ester cyclase [Phototrophicaceae bacterium]
MDAREIIRQHLRAVEAGDWNAAIPLLAEDYRMSGMIPFPRSLFTRIGKNETLRMYQARKRSLPDFKFNETYMEATESHVRIQVNGTGTHTGEINYYGILRGIPVVAATGKFVKLNPEWFTYYIRDGLIAKSIAEIPKDAGVEGLVRAVTATA